MPEGGGDVPRDRRSVSLPVARNVNSHQPPLPALRDGPTGGKQRIEGFRESVIPVSAVVISHLGHSLWTQFGKEGVDLGRANSGRVHGGSVLRVVGLAGLAACPGIPVGSPGTDAKRR